MHASDTPGRIQDVDAYTAVTEPNSSHRGLTRHSASRVICARAMVFLYELPVPLPATSDSAFNRPVCDPAAATEALS